RQEIASRAASEAAASRAYDRALTVLEGGEVAQGLLLLVDALRLAPAESTELQRSIRTSIAGWRKELHALLAVLPHPRCVNAVAFSPDGATLLTACSDGRARLWACATGEPI